MVGRHGFKVTKYDRNAGGKEKKVDTAITYQMAKDAHKGIIRAKEDEITLVAGDKENVPAVEDLVREGFTIHIVFWDHAAQELKKAASKFVSLDPFLDHLTKPWEPI